jgi:hypothetical protein
MAITVPTERVSPCVLQEGSLTLDGADIKTLNLRWLRAQLGLVGQVCMPHAPSTHHHRPPTGDTCRMHHRRTITTAHSHQPQRARAALR